MDWVPHFHYDLGVSFFFVLSGFILSCTYRSFDTVGSLREFYVARIARIWPLHLLLLAAFLIVIPMDGWFPGDTAGYKTGIFFANVFLVHAWIPSVAFFFGLNAVSWSISTEAFFYLIFPMLRHKWETNWHWKSLFVFLIVASILTITTFVDVAPINPNEPVKISNIGWGYISPFVRMIEFVLGMLAASLYDLLSKRKLPQGVIAWTVLEVAAIMLIVGCERALGYSMNTAWEISSPFLAASPLFAACIIVFAFGRGLISKCISIRPLLVLGEASFALYLSHLLLLNVLSRHLPYFESPDYVICIGFWVVAITVALMLWKFVEKPARNKIRKIASSNRSQSSSINAV